MKPQIDRMVEGIVKDLSGEARSFYEREFSFFHEVTSISGKLKPYIKKSKKEKRKEKKVQQNAQRRAERAVMDQDDDDMGMDDDQRQEADFANFLSNMGGEFQI